MKWLLDRVIILAIVGGLIYAGMWAFKSHLETKKQIALEQLKHNDSKYLNQIVELKDEIVKLKSQSVSERKLIKSIKQELSNEVVKLIKQHKEKPQVITIATTDTKQQVQLDPKIWKHYENPDNPHAEYYFMKLYKSDEHETKIPWAWVMYFPNRKEHKWKYGFYPLQIKSKTVVTKQKTGGLNSYTQITVENKKDKESKGKIQKLKINPKNSYVKFVYPPKQKTFHFWNPNLSVGLGTYYNISNNDDWITGMEFGFNFLNYGIKERVDYKFMTLGFGSNFGSDNWAFLTPLEINMQVFRIPLIHHLYLTPIKIGFTDDKDWIIGTGINIEF